MESVLEIDFSFCNHQVGNDTAARDRGSNGLRLAQETHDPDVQAFALTALAYAWEGLGDNDQAAQAFGEAFSLRKTTSCYAAECQAGLARLRLKTGDAAGALHYLEKVLEYRDAAFLNLTPLPGKEWLRADPFDATLRTFEIYLTCFQVLKAAGDPRAIELLSYAVELLKERSGRIEDPEKRQVFLTKVRSHREILAAWEKEQAENLTGFENL